MGSDVWIILLNFIVCTFGGYMTVCRQTMMSASTKMNVRLQYMIWFCAFCTSGWSFAFGDPAQIPQLMLSTMMAGAIYLGAAPWRHGAPHYTRRIGT